MKNEYSYLSDRCHSAGTACLFSHRLAERREYVMGTILQYVLYLAILVALAVLFGKYIGRIMHVKEDEEMMETVRGKRIRLQHHCTDRADSDPYVTGSPPMEPSGTERNLMGPGIQQCSQLYHKYQLEGLQR